MDALQQRCDELDRDKQHMHEAHQTSLDKLAAQVHHIATTSIAQHNCAQLYTTLYSTSAVCDCKLHCTCVQSAALVAGVIRTAVLGATHLADSAIHC
jgi:hypothetical protein